MNQTPTAESPAEIPDTKRRRLRLPRKKPSRKHILCALAVLLLLLCAFGLYRLFFAEEERIALTGTTSYGSLNEAIEGSGTTTPADSVTYEFSGTVLEWCVQAGDEVQAGDLLYVLDASEAEDEILDTEVELEELYEELSDLQENIAGQQMTAPFAGRIESIQVSEGQSVQNGKLLAKLIDDSTMQTTLYFSYGYQDQIRVGTSLQVSVPDQMLTLSGRVTEIHYVDYVTSEGLSCFAVTAEVKNPGSLREGMSVSAWLEASDGTAMYAATDAVLEYGKSEELTAEATGELTGIHVVDYQQVKAGELLFSIDASQYETQMETLRKQIENYEEKILDLQESIDTEYTRYADIAGQVVSADYMTNRITGTDMGSVVIYDQTSMEISVNIDELDADFLTQGMDVTVYRTTASKTEQYPATLSYLSLEASSNSSGVSTFAATITIDSDGALSSGVTVYYSIDTGGGDSTEETVLAPLQALCSYDDGYYLLVQSENKPDTAIDPSAVGGSVTDYPDGYYAVPVEVGSFNETNIQILSGVEADSTVFLRYRNTAPSGGDSTSVAADEEDSGTMPQFDGQMPDFSGGQMPDFSGGGMTGGGQSGGRGGGGMPSFG